MSNYIKAALATMAMMDVGFTPPPIVRRRSSKAWSPTLHPTKGWRGVKKKHRAKFKRRGRKS